MNLTQRLFRAVRLGLLAAAFSGLTLFGTDIPGSATMPPRSLKTPNPPLPADDRMAGLQLLVWLRADGTVDEVERVRGDEEWFPAVAAAVRQWTFEPVLAAGQPIPARLEVGVGARHGEISLSFSPLPNLPGELHSKDELGVSPPVLLEEPEVIVPLEGRIRLSMPKAIIRYVVEEDGSTGQFVVAEAPSEATVRAALDLVAAQRFRPGTIRGAAVPVEYITAVAFRGAAEKIPGLEGVATAADPVYPYERLLANEEGNATVRFRLGVDGRVEETAVLEATHPEFGAALAVAVETWQFTTEAAAEKPEREVGYEFRADRVPHGARRLAEVIRSGGEISNKAAGLDAKPQVLARPALAYPRALFATGTAGRAKVEFIVDRSGLAQLPRVLEASAPEFGWAAANWASGMRFAPLTRGGQAAELRVVLPVQFTPPAAGGR